MNRRERWILGVCFFFGGATSLVLQVAWSKELSYILGNTLYAVATVVAAFMAGLGIGSALAGRFAERVSNPLRAYAYVQFGIAACGMISIPLFRATEPLFRFLFQALEPGQGAFLLARFGVVFVLMLVPVTLMGMTLPIVIGAYARRKEKYGFEAGIMYGVNTIGAVAGTWGAGFFMLPTLGLWKTCAAVGLTDAAIGLVALWIEKRTGAIEDIRAVERRHGGATAAASPSWTWKQWTAGGVFAVSGAAAMVYEVGWFRLLGLTIGPSVYAFSVMLGMFLLGVGLGSALVARWVERTKWSGLAAMAALEGLLGLVGLAGLFYYNRLPEWNFSFFVWGTDTFGEPGMFLGQMGVAATMVLPPCLLMGALFPVTVRAVRELGSHETAPEANVGRLYVMNTFGGIVGSLAAGFFIVPNLGVWKTLLAASLVSVILALALLMLMTRERWMTQVAWAFGLAAAAAGLTLTAPSWNAALFNQGLYRDVYTARRMDLDRVRRQKLVYYGEGINSPVAVFNTGGEGTLRVAGKADASTIAVDFYTQLFVGHLPVMFAESPRRAAVIGYGSGMSAMALLTHPEIESLDVIEIERAVIKASPFFECINLNPLGDPRANLVLEDGRVYLTHTAKTYDVITSEPSNPWMAGVSNLFTVDFYRIVRERLTPEGVFGQWIQIYELDENTFKAILSSLHDVFPHVAIFRSGVGDVVVLASGRPIRVPWDVFRKRFMEERVLNSFARADITHPLQLFFYFHGPEEFVKAYIAGTTLRNTDDNVWLEYRMPRNMVQAKTAYGMRDRNIGITLLQSGAAHRLGAFEDMLTGVPPEGAVQESLTYQYGLEMGVHPTGAVMDSWISERGVLTRGLRAELVERGDAGFSAAFERWVEEGEAKLRRHVATIQKLMTVRDVRSEIAAVRNAVDEAPELPMARVVLANTLYQNGDIDNAEIHYRVALKYAASYAHYDALVGLGNIALQRGEREQAREFFERATRRSPFQPVAFRNLAALLRGGNAETLREVAERGLLFNPGDEDLERVLAALP